MTFDPAGVEQRHEYHFSIHIRPLRGQEEMKGPISSLMQNIKEEAEGGDKVSKEEADRKKDENM